MKEKNLEQRAAEQPKEKPIIISARTALIAQDDAAQCKLPQSYESRTVKDGLDYLQGSGLDAGGKTVMKSVEKEMGKRNYVVVVNGKNAQLADTIHALLVEKEHKLRNKTVKPYLALEIEVSSVEEGGYHS